MKVGVAFPTVIESPVDPVAFARKAEEVGFESMWIPEHPVVPVYARSKFPDSPDGRIPETYSHMIDPFMALSAASAVTTTLKLATGICLVPERNPILLAKLIASLDHYSRGRFIFGIGAGWFREETELMGGDFDHRWTQTREHVEAMKALWTQDESEFHGKYVDFPLVRCYPKPAQKPHPPVLLGGRAKNVFQRIVRWADGWYPNRITPDEVKQGRAILDELASAAGRDPVSVQISVSGQAPDRDLIQRYEEAGAIRVVVRGEGESTDEALSWLEEASGAILG